MVSHFNVANQLLNIEQKLIAYEALHQEELKELWKAINDCKRLILTTCDDLDEEAVSVEPLAEKP
jgi:hypothetical protein